MNETQRNEYEYYFFIVAQYSFVAHLVIVPHLFVIMLIFTSDLILFSRNHSFSVKQIKKLIGRVTIGMIIGYCLFINKYGRKRLKKWNILFLFKIFISCFYYGFHVFYWCCWGEHTTWT